MTPRLKALWRALRYCGDCLLLLACWGLWLVLGALLAAQIAVVVSKQFAVPGFVLRSIEERFTAARVDARFGRATFDIRGGVVLEHLRLSLPEFAEPVVELRAVHIELDPWLLLTGRFEPRRLRATGAKLFVPAMLAPSGRSEEILSELDFSLAFAGGTRLDIEHLSARIAGVAVALRGGFQPPRLPDAGRTAALPLLETFARHYATLSRQLIRAGERLAAFDRPQLDVTLEPSTERGAIASIALTARGAKYPAFHDLSAEEIRFTTRLPLLGEAPAMSPLQLAVGNLRLAGGTARDLQASLRGSLNPAQFTYRPREIQATAREVSARGFSVEFAAARIEPQLFPLIDGEIVALCLGAPLALAGRADLAKQSASVQVGGMLSPRLLDPISLLLRRDVRRFIGFGQPVALDALVTFSPGWKFERLAGHVSARSIDAYRVPMDSAHGEIEFDGRRFVARRAIARLGENVARGSFEQDLKTREFRFLLEGRLRPLDIGGWFRSWWPEFFANFDFPEAPPDASVDVAGRWRAGWETTVFVFAESNGPVIRGARFDYARTRMFIRPNFFDGLEFFGTRGTGDLRGVFTRTLDAGRREWKELTLAFSSTIDLEAGAKLLGPALGPRLEPFAFEHAPRVNVSGRFDEPAAPEGEHQSMQIEARSHGGFSAYRVPGQNLSFDATLRDSDLTLENVSADIAGGRVSGRARIWGTDRERRVGFDGAVHGARLGEAVATVSRYLANRKGQAESRPDRVLPGKNSTKLDLALSAEGLFDDPLSYRGSGNASVDGPELGEVRLLGLLSELLNFTALRFTHAQADFKVEGPRVAFPSVSVTGANSAIHARGDYSLQHGELDFNARVYPFQESKSILQSFVGVMLSPLSAVLEVKLTGPLHEPKWAFVIGPTNLFRSLAEPATNTPADSQSAKPADYLRRLPANDAKTH